MRQFQAFKIQITLQALADFSLPILFALALRDYFPSSDQGGSLIVIGTPSLIGVALNLSALKLVTKNPLKAATVAVVALVFDLGLYFGYFGLMGNTTLLFLIGAAPDRLYAWWFLTLYLVLFVTTIISLRAFILFRRANV